MIKKRGPIIVLILGVFFLTQNLESTWTFKRLTWTSGRSFTPAIARDSNNHIHLVWQEESPGNEEIFYKQSTDGGANWSQNRLTWNSGNSSWPAIAVDSNNHIHVVWQDKSPGNNDNEIFYKQSTDEGLNWTTKRLTWTAGFSSYPVIASDSNNHLHVVWCEDPTFYHYEIYYKRSTDKGENWTTKRLTWFSGDSYEPAIAVDSNNHLHVVWYDRKTYIGNYEIYYKQSTDSGENWVSKRLTWTASESSEPAITVDSNNHVHVIWSDGAGFPEIFYKQSTDNGANWSRERLTWNPGASYSPAIVSDTNNHIHVVWNDTTPGNAEIFYKKKD